jgi:hypothetical protein
MENGIASAPIITITGESLAALRAAGFGLMLWRGAIVAAIMPLDTEIVIERSASADAIRQKYLEWKAGE